MSKNAFDKGVIVKLKTSIQSYSNVTGIINEVKLLVDTISSIFASKRSTIHQSDAGESKDKDETIFLDYFNQTVSHNHSFQDTDSNRDFKFKAFERVFPKMNRLESSGFAK